MMTAGKVILIGSAKIVNIIRCARTNTAGDNHHWYTPAPPGRYPKFLRPRGDIYFFIFKCNALVLIGIILNNFMSFPRKQEWLQLKKFSQIIHFKNYLLSPK